MAMTLKQLCMLQPLNWLKDKYIKQGKTMKFDEVNRRKDGRLIKPRDPNFQAMIDLKKSGAAGSHGDKTKEIPRKAKHKDKDIEESPIEQDKDNPIAKPYVDTPEWKALHDMDDKIIQAYNKHKKKSVSESDENAPARLLGVAQAHLGYGLEMAQYVLDGDKFKAESMARVIVDGWPDAIDKIQNVYKIRKSNGEDINEFIDDRVGTVVKTSQGKRVKILQADPKQGLYKVEFQSGVEVYMSRDDLNLEVPTDALGKETKPRDWKHPWDIGEDKEKPTDKEIKQAKGIAFDKRYKDGNYTGASNTIEKLKKGLSKHPDVANALKRANEDLDSPAHKAQSSIWHKSNPIGRNFMDPDDYDSDARGTHIIMDNPTELHFYKVPAKDYDEAFDKWLDGKNSDRVQDHEFYDSTKDYASDHQYWGRIAPENDTMNWPDDDPDREDDDDWSDKDEKEFGTAKKPDDQEEPKKEGSQSSIPKGNIGDLVRVRKEDDEHDGRLGRIVDFFSDDEGQYYTLAFDDEVDTTEYGAGENNYEIGELEFLDQTVDRRDEGGMPSSVIRHKQKLSDMTDKELADRFKDFDEETLRQMAWRHGYGKMDSHYWDRVQAGKQEEAIIKDARTKILEKFGVTDLEDYKEKMKTLYGLERYMKKDPELADEIKRRYIELRQWKKDYDASNEGNYEQQLYDGIKETATAGATSAGSIATVVSPDLAYHNPKKKGKHGAPKAPQKKKGDGTAVNALDMGNNLMGGTPMKR